MKVNLRLLTIQLVGLFGVFALVLFLSAGTIAWRAGWVFLILFFGFTIALSTWLIRYNPGLLMERMTGQGRPDQKSWDKVFVQWIRVAFLAWLVLMPLDAVRFHWSHVPNWLQWVGVLLLLVSFYFFVLVYRANAFLSPAVRVQKERGHSVVSTGPYRFVRHPMYGTAILWLFGTALLLGSWYGLLAGLVLILAFAFRAVHEERTLRAELPGYEEYLARVKHRFIPGVW